jgi:hypothetical protein
MKGESHLGDLIFRDPETGEDFDVDKVFKVAVVDLVNERWGNGERLREGFSARDVVEKLTDRNFLEGIDIENHSTPIYPEMLKEHFGLNVEVWPDDNILDKLIAQISIVEKIN